MPKFESLGFGGTFDRLHSGHTLILDLAAYYGSEIQIGLIGENYLKQHKKIHGESIFPYSKRKECVINYLKNRKNPCKIIKIDTIDKDKEYAIESDLNAILVSPETIAGALAINRKRKLLKTPPLIIILVPFVTSKNGMKISSSTLRKKNTPKS